ncbi:MAG: AAA family ATPase [Candidatus Methanomethylophilaceae archaeon]|nr:AAA family ATPase [Candidatus Methanomethylophilaceae archaeon]
MFERGSRIIRDPKVFDYDYVPPKLIGRDEQLSTMELLFRPLAEYGRSCTAVLMGPVGTGKTAAAKCFCRDLAEHCAKKGSPIEAIFVNCRARNSEAAVLLQMVQHFDRGFPDRGFSPDQMWRALRQQISGEGKDIVIVLDEVDVLLKKSSMDLVYQISRFTEGGPDIGRSVSLVMISQEPLFDLLDEASFSSFRRTNSVIFDRYDMPELREIVLQRANAGILPGRIGDEPIDMIAESASEYGDARMAIELLDRAANMAEGEGADEIDAEHVRGAKAMIYSTVSESKLKTLDRSRMLALLAVSRAIRKQTSISITAAEKTYAVVCEEYGETPRKHTQFWTYIQDIEKLGVIKTAVVNEASGRTTRISLPGIPSKVLAEKVETLIEKASE